MTLRERSLGGGEGRGHLQSLALLLLDAAETVLCSLAGFGVGHAEHVVSFNSTVHTGVAGDGLSKHKALRFVLDAVEGSDGLITGLIVVLIYFHLGSGLRSRVLNFGVLTSKESVHGCWGNWLLQKT